MSRFTQLAIVATFAATLWVIPELLEELLPPKIVPVRVAVRQRHRRW